MTQATSAKTTTTTQQSREAWERRAVELAQAAHLDGAAQLRADGDLARHYLVPNRDRHGAGHWVSVSLDGRHITRCDCVAGTFKQPCCHVGSVLHAERQRAAATSSRSEAWDYWKHGGEW